MGSRLKIGILATHPIQYHAPLFRELARREQVELSVYFCHQPTPEEQGKGFGVAFEWDVDLLSGYRHEFMSNRAKHPTQGFFGYDTPEISDIIDREHFDAFIVHGWNNKACWQAFLACWRSGTPLGVRSDSQLPRPDNSTTIHRWGQGLKTMIKNLVYPSFIGKFDYCFPYGQRSAEYFQHFGGKKIIIAPHFVKNNFFSTKAEQAQSQRNALRNRWGIPQDSFCFLFCGKFQPKKRPLDILEAFCRLKTTTAEDSRPVHLLMVGDGEMKQQAEEWTLAHDLQVGFAGFLNQQEIVQAYAACDCLVLASNYTETWGLVVNEAMACGLPAIVSDACGCIPDLIDEGMTGHSYPCGDIEALTERMQMIANDHSSRELMSLAIHQHISGFDAKTAADKLLAALQQR
jgi:glycosyltransferase involved in cell wall biosynthesis